MRLNFYICEQSKGGKCYQVTKNACEKLLNVSPEGAEDWFSDVVPQYIIYGPLKKGDKPYLIYVTSRIKGKTYHYGDVLNSMSQEVRKDTAEEDALYWRIIDAFHNPAPPNIHL